jgi:hypothetical protein
MCKNPSSAPQYLIKQVIADLCASFALLLGGTGDLRAIPRSCGDSGRCPREVSKQRNINCRPTFMVSAPTNRLAPLRCSITTRLEFGASIALG